MEIVQSKAERERHGHRMEADKTAYKKGGKKLRNFPCNKDWSVQLLVCSSALLTAQGAYSMYYK